jgi:hypothetical protein
MIRKAGFLLLMIAAALSVMIFSSCDWLLRQTGEQKQYEKEILAATDALLAVMEEGKSFDITMYRGETDFIVTEGTPDAGSILEEEIATDFYARIALDAESVYGTPMALLQTADGMNTYFFNGIYYQVFPQYQSVVGFGEVTGSESFDFIVTDEFVGLLSEDLETGDIVRTETDSGYHYESEIISMNAELLELFADRAFEAEFFGGSLALEAEGGVIFSFDLVVAWRTEEDSSGKVTGGVSEWKYEFRYGEYVRPVIIPAYIAAAFDGRAGTFVNPIPLAYNEVMSVSFDEFYNEQAIFSFTPTETDDYLVLYYGIGNGIKCGVLMDENFRFIALGDYNRPNQVYHSMDYPTFTLEADKTYHISVLITPMYYNNDTYFTFRIFRLDGNRTAAYG